MRTRAWLSLRLRPLLVPLLLLLSLPALSFKSMHAITRRRSLFTKCNKRNKCKRRRDVQMRGLWSAAVGQSGERRQERTRAKKEARAASRPPPPPTHTA